MIWLRASMVHLIGRAPPPLARRGGERLLVVELEPVLRRHARVGVVGRVGLGWVGRGVVGPVGRLERGDAVGDAGLIRDEPPQRVVLHLLHGGEEIQHPDLLIGVPPLGRAPNEEARRVVAVAVLAGRFARVRGGDDLVPRPVVVVVDLHPPVIADALAVGAVAVAEGEHVDGDAVPRRPGARGRASLRFAALSSVGGAAQANAVVAREGLEVRPGVRAAVHVQDGGDAVVGVRA